MYYLKQESFENLHNESNLNNKLYKGCKGLSKIKI